MDWLTAERFWTALGTVGAVVFYGRFYVQWLVSERRKRSVIPIAFWYMSSVGSLLLLVYAVAIRSPVGALGQSFNIVVYGRNLVHLWRERGTLTKERSIAAHAVMGTVAVLALSLVAYTWLREYEVNRAASSETAVRNWVWVAVGTVGQALFAARFLVQWIATEIKRRSVVPPAFWYLSIAAATLQMACFAQRSEWIFVAGMAATLLIYGRNIWLLRIQEPEESA